MSENNASCSNISVNVPYFLKYLMSAIAGEELLLTIPFGKIRMNLGNDNFIYFVYLAIIDHF